MTRREIVDEIISRMVLLGNFVEGKWRQKERKYFNKLLKDFANENYELGFQDAECEYENMCGICGNKIK